MIKSYCCINFVCLPFVLTFSFASAAEAIQRIKLIVIITVYAIVIANVIVIVIITVSFGCNVLFVIEV